MKSALLHVSVPCLLCVAAASSGLFDGVDVDLSYEHYAEKPVDSLPGFLAMPCNSLVNLGYVILGLYWLFRRTGGAEDRRTGYMREVFRRTGGAEDRRTGGAEDRRTGGAEDRRTGGAEDRRTGYMREVFRRTGGAEDRRTGGAEDRRTGGAEDRRTGGAEDRRTGYMREVFALMALLYAPVQWTRLATLRRAPAVLDQWFTLPIFAWVPVWCDVIQQGAAWRPWRAVVVQLCSVLSYGLAFIHEQGFEVALGGHVVLAVYGALRLQRDQGDGRSQRYLGLAVVSCAGFVVLKLLDHQMARYWLFQRFTGHFWSKVCDVGQFHYSFCFLTCLAHRHNTDMTKME